MESKVSQETASGNEAPVVARRRHRRVLDFLDSTGQGEGRDFVPVEEEALSHFGCFTRLDMPE
jgi:hypothetical protein